LRASEQGGGSRQRERACNSRPLTFVATAALRNAPLAIANYETTIKTLNFTLVASGLRDLPRRCSSHHSSAAPTANHSTRVLTGCAASTRMAVLQEVSLPPVGDRLPRASSQNNPKQVSNGTSRSDVLHSGAQLSPEILRLPGTNAFPSLIPGPRPVARMAPTKAQMTRVSRQRSVAAAGLPIPHSGHGAHPVEANARKTALEGATQYTRATRTKNEAVPLAHVLKGPPTISHSQYY